MNKIVLYKSSIDECHFPPSVTKPNMALSISEILKRYSVGRDVPYCAGSYDTHEGFEDVPEPDLDIVDREDYISAMEDQAMRQRPLKEATAVQQAMTKASETSETKSSEQTVSQS